MTKRAWMKFRLWTLRFAVLATSIAKIVLRQFWKG